MGFTDSLGLTESGKSYPSEPQGTVNNEQRDFCRLDVCRGPVPSRRGNLVGEHEAVPVACHDTSL
jgi:hypothetical protein